MNEFSMKKKRRHVREIPLAPVLDLLTVVIFFLVLSTSFTEFTKHTLPPSAVNTISDPAARTPVNPKLLALRRGDNVELTLRWTGDKPGQEKQALAAAGEKSLREGASFLTGLLKSRFPGESSLQIGLSSNMTYQEMISIMDGARENVQDLVMIAPSEAETQDANASL